jgi:hypothetical protein
MVSRGQEHAGTVPADKWNSDGHSVIRLWQPEVLQKGTVAPKPDQGKLSEEGDMQLNQGWVASARNHRATRDSRQEASGLVIFFGKDGW